jgi:hypothetical protein
MFDTISNLIWGPPRFTATVTTGDRFGAGTNSTVWMQVIDTLGMCSAKTYLDKTFVDDHERGETNTYRVYATGLERPHEVAFIAVGRDKSILFDDRWLLDKIVVIFYSKFQS